MLSYYNSWHSIIRLLTVWDVMIRIQEASLSATMQMQVLFKPSKRMLHGSILSLHALFVMYYVEAEKGNFTRFRKLSNVRRSAPMRPSAIRIPQPWRACTTSIAIQFNFAGCGCNLRNPHSANMNSVYGVRDAEVASASRIPQS